MSFLLVFAVVYASANIYAGLRTLQWLKSFVSISPAVYWSFVIVAAASPIISRIAARAGISEAKSLSIAGDWWLAITYFSVLLWLTIDIIRLADSRFNFLPLAVKSVFVQGILVNTLLLALLLYGFWNALHPVITRYDITISKKADSLGSIRAVLVSDIHMGRIVGPDRVEKLVNIVNGLNPDIVFYAGDIIDDDTSFVAARNLMAPLAKIKPRLGTYAILGNHEYIGGQPDEAVRLMETAGIRVLRDQTTLVANAFYVAGRDDLSKQRYDGRDRQSLAAVVAGVDRSLPLILLDHQPSRIDEAVKQDIDLQLSGHTHLGQFFPNNLVTRLIYEQDWGYLKKESFQLIVSCGYGTWGPPVRLGNKPEIVELTIRFKQ